MKKGVLGEGSAKPGRISPSMNSEQIWDAWQRD